MRFEQNMHLRIFLSLLPLLFITGCGDSDLSADSNAGKEDPLESLHPGKQIYDDYCFSCHTPGLSGAPKIGDQEVWEVRLAQGKQTLLDSTINGIQPAMPPRGVCFECSDQELELAIDYIILQSQ